MMKRVVELAAKKVPLDSGQYPAFTVLVFKDAQYSHSSLVIRQYGGAFYGRHYAAPSPFTS